MTARRTFLPWALAAIAPCLIVGAEVAKVASGRPLAEDALLLPPTLLGASAMGAVGALLASRTSNPLGWILLAIPLGTGVSVLADPFMAHGAEVGASYTSIAYWLTGWPFFTSLSLLVAVFFLFPTGTVPSPRWRTPWRVYVVAAVLTIVGFAVQPSTQVLDGGATVRNPLGVGALGDVLGIVLAIAGVTVLLSSFLASASLVARFRRAGADERQQLRWLFPVGAAGAVRPSLLLVTASIASQRGAGTTITGRVPSVGGST